MADDIVLTDASGGALPDLDGAMAEAAETVRRALVRLRGGAPFLSSEDVAVLVGWLDAEVPVARILRGLEVAASRRRAQRVRAPLQLRHARRWLGRPTARARAVPPLPVGGATSRPDHPLAPLLASVDGLDPRLASLGAALGRDLLALEPEPLDALVDAAADRLVAFFDAAWTGLGEAGRARYLDRAAAHLADALDDLDDATRDQLLDEHGRGLLRDDLPGLSLTSLLLLVDA